MSKFDYLPGPDHTCITNELLSENWPNVKELRGDPEKVTRWFHAAIPVLKFLDWRVVESDLGYCKTVLPLNKRSTNQYITHQAAIILLSADYTGGFALASLLNGTPVVGIHPQESDYGAYTWGAKAEIKWIKPSCDDLICVSRIPKKRHAAIAKRFFRGERVLYTGTIEMFNGNDLVAISEFTYWVQDTYSLRKNAFEEESVHLLYDHQQKTSAKLIAGLRGMERNRPETERLFDDPISEQLAGNHGMILAERFCMVAPQLQPMVSARTRHLDDTLNQFHNGQSCQVVNIGSGLDSRIFRCKLPEGSKVYELDLPLMLTKRKRLLENLPEAPAKRIEVPIDLRTHDLAKAIFNSNSYKPDVPTFVIWEGGSMYFTTEEVRALLKSIKGILKSPSSMLWMDYVDQSVVDGTTGHQIVEEFKDAMACLGEPFINGYEDIAKEMSEVGFEVTDDTESNVFCKSDDPVYGLYRFCSAKVV